MLAILDVFFDVFLSILFIALLVFLASFFIIRDLKKEYLKVLKVQSKFDIELRKLVNLMSKILNNEKLSPFETVVIKKLPHEQKKILLKNIDEIFEQIDMEDKDNAYIIETYERLQETRRTRDSKVLIYNNKIVMFPYNLYARILKFSKYEVYTTSE